MPYAEPTRTLPPQGEHPRHALPAPRGSTLDALLFALALSALWIATEVVSPVSPSCGDYGDTAYVSPWFNACAAICIGALALASLLCLLCRTHVATKVAFVLVGLLTTVASAAILFASTVPCGFH
jgi:hypothetical protein